MKRILELIKARLEQQTSNGKELAKKWQDFLSELESFSSLKGFFTCFIKNKKGFEILFSLLLKQRINEISCSVGGEAEDEPETNVAVVSGESPAQQNNKGTAVSAISKQQESQIE